MKPGSEPNSEIVLYQTEDGQTRLEVRFQAETAWLTQQQMAELFQTTKQNVSLHIQNAFREGELLEDSVVKESLTTAADGKDYRTKFYNLENFYIEFAELRALDRKPMYMRDWITKLDDFLRLSGRDILTHAGSISHEQAVQKAEQEFEKYRAIQINEPSQVEKDFAEAVKKLPGGKKSKP